MLQTKIDHPQKLNGPFLAVGTYVKPEPEDFTVPTRTTTQDPQRDQREAFSQRTGTHVSRMRAIITKPTLIFCRISGEDGETGEGRGPLGRW